MDSISRWSPNYRFHRSLAMLQSPSFRQGLPESSHRDVNLGAGINFLWFPSSRFTAIKLR